MVKINSELKFNKIKINLFKTTTNPNGCYYTFFFKYKTVFRMLTPNHFQSFPKSAKWRKKVKVVKK